MPLPSLPSAKTCALIVALFFATNFAVYSSSLRDDFVSWDDTSLIVDNPVIASFNTHTIAKAFSSYDPELYIPLTFVSYQIDHLIAGFHPFIYHLTNLVFHTLNAVLVAWFLYLLIANGWLALGLGLVFALHPLNTEAVAWASARKDVLSTFFFFGSILLYIYGSEKSHSRFRILSVVSFILGLLAKVSVVTLPVVLVLVDLIHRKQLNWKTQKDKIPYIFFAIIFGLIAMYGKSGVLVSSTYWQKLLMAGKSTEFYLQKFFWPTDLSVIYPYTDIITIRSADFAVPFFLMLVLVGAIFFFWKKYRVPVIALIFFLVTLAPSFINFAKGGDIYFASDRYVYIPMTGLLLLIGSLTDMWLQNAVSMRSVEQRLRMTTGCAALILAAFSILSFRQSTVWANSMSLYENTLASYPNSRTALNNLGMEYLAMRDTDTAIKLFKQSLAIQAFPLTRVNLAAAEVQRGNFEAALEIYRSLVVSDPDFPDSYYGIGNVYQKQGALQEAADQYRKTIEVDPEYFNAYNNLGAVYLQLHQWDQGIDILKKSIELKPGFIESYYNLAVAYKEQGNASEAEIFFRKAADLNPRDADAHANLAELLYARGEIDEAAGLLRSALAIDSSNPIAVSLVLQMKKDGLVR